MTESIAHRRLKRKRPSTDDTTEVKLSGKLHHTLREVKKEAKKAKIFETQKLVKKLKALRGSNKNTTEVSDLERQLEVFKHVDLNDFAIVSLRNKLKKNRILSANSVVNHFMEKELTISKPDIDVTSVEGKVRNRLMSSKTLSLGTSLLIEDLHVILQPGGAGVVTDEGNKEDNIGPDIKQRMATRVKKGDKIYSGEEHDPGGFREVQDEETQEWAFEMDKVGCESSSVISKQEDDDGWESGSIGANEDERCAVAQDEGRGDSEEEPPSNSNSDSDIAVDIPSKSRIASSSTFLPSLSVGFIRGGSDSDSFSDNEAGFADGVKKNRRGQRARQAIWEKKYGRSAKHLTKQRELEQQKPKSSRDGRGGKYKTANEIHSRSLPVKFQPPVTRDSGYPLHATAATISSSVIPPAKRVRREEKPLHPSWEAKKKLKEKQKAAILPAQGKKIVF